MGNLGWYQILTSLAKKVGGPKKLVGIMVGGGALLGGGAVAGGSAIIKKLDNTLAEKKRISEAAVVHTVLKSGVSNEGVSFELGDTFKILDADGDVTLIEKQGNENNPYYVSAKFLSSISDFNVI